MQDFGQVEISSKGSGDKVASLKLNEDDAKAIHAIVTKAFNETGDDVNYEDILNGVFYFRNMASNI